MGDVRIVKPQARADELEDRLIDFAVRIIKLSANLPKTHGKSFLSFKQ
ncbi:MAG TPA: hypothetical protein VF955_09075 [Pyrinomonadaceae bacterium]